MSLKARRVSKKFGTTEAVREVDLEIAQGEVVALLGPSGSGKSTLLYLLSGVLLPDQGEVWFGDVAIHSSSEDERSRLRRSAFGFVFQFGQLLPELTAQENVALPLWLEGRHSRMDAMTKAQLALEQLDIAKLADRLPGSLSGGEAQRVAVARAFVIEPEMVFADEPTGSLDSAMESVVLEGMTAMATQRGTGVVIVTHSARVASIAHRQITMLDGRLSAGK